MKTKTIIKRISKKKFEIFRSTMNKKRYILQIVLGYLIYYSIYELFQENFVGGKK